MSVFLICMQDGRVGESAGTCQGFYLLMCYFLLLPDNICTKLWCFSKHFHAYIDYALIVCLSLFPFSHTCSFSICITFSLNVNLLLSAMYVYDDDGVCVCMCVRVCVTSRSLDNI